MENRRARDEHHMTVRPNSGTNLKKSEQPTGQPSAISSWKARLEQATGTAVAATSRSTPAATVYLLLDCSGSMGGRDKLAAAKSGTMAFAHDADTQGYAVGLIAFATTPTCCREASRGVDGLDQAVSQVQAGGSTDLAAALKLAIQKIAHRPGQRVLCIVTDGQPDDASAALAAARDAVKHRIDIMALGTDDADKTFLDQIVTSKELAIIVARLQLQKGISDMARLLPGHTDADAR